MDILLYLALWTLPIVVGYFVIRLAVRHGVMDAHRRLHLGEIGRPDDSRPNHLRHRKALSVFGLALGTSS